MLIASCYTAWFWGQDVNFYNTLAVRWDRTFPITGVQARPGQAGSQKTNKQQQQQNKQRQTKNPDHGDDRLLRDYAIPVPNWAGPASCRDAHMYDEHKRLVGILEFAGFCLWIECNGTKWRTRGWCGSGAIGGQVGSVLQSAIFWDNVFNIMVAGVLVPCVATTSTVMALHIHNNRICPLHWNYLHFRSVEALYKCTCIVCLDIN